MVDENMEPQELWLGAGLTWGAEGGTRMLFVWRKHIYSLERNTCGSSSPLQFVLLQYLSPLRVFSVWGINFETPPIGVRSLRLAGFSCLLVLKAAFLLVWFSSPEVLWYIETYRL